MPLLSTHLGRRARVSRRRGRERQGGSQKAATRSEDGGGMEQDPAGTRTEQPRGTQKNTAVGERAHPNRIGRGGNL